VALLEKRRFLYNHSGDFPQVILIVPSHVPNNIGPGFLTIVIIWPLPQPLTPHSFVSISSTGDNSYEDRERETTC
jgi:hypothetical protein